MAMTEVRETPTAGGAGASDQAKERAQQAAGQAHEAAGKAKDRVTVEVDRRSSQAGASLQSTASDARSVAEELRGRGKDKPAQVAERAAEQVDRIGGYLQASDGERILRDVEAFGRRNSWTVAAGGLALGFAASRFLKASSSRRYQEAAATGSASPRIPDRVPAWPSDIQGPGSPQAPPPAAGAPPQPATPGAV
jgi:hypothetical protein